MTTLGTLGAVLLLGSLGLVMGALSLTGWLPTAVEFGLWVAVGVTWVVAGSWMGLERPVVTLLAVGLVAGVLTGGIQGALAGTLVENNPSYAENVEAPVDGGDRFRFFAVAVGVGLVWGLLFGLAAWGLRAAGVLPGWGG